MNKKTLQDFLNGEHDMLTTAVDLFRTLLPHHKNDASVHSGEEGRFIEMALAEYLRKKLPDGIGIGGGFIVDAHSGWASKQIDIILYDRIRFAPLLKYGDALVVPIESVIGALSVKRTLYDAQLPGELESLSSVGARGTGMNYPKPLLALIAFDYEKDDFKAGVDATFAAIQATFSPKTAASGKQYLHSWNELVDYVIVFDKFLMRTNGHSHRDDTARKKELAAKNAKGEKLPPLQCNYTWAGNRDLSRNAYLQHLLNGIHRAWYDRDRENLPKRDLLAFPDTGMNTLGAVPICVYCRPYAWSTFTPAISPAQNTTKTKKRRTTATKPSSGAAAAPLRSPTTKKAKKARKTTAGSN
ncbi:DUF6602 domain-containing protein [Herbaspirillum chlorophenolicum]|uniref:DUF6602 domain-containing protein n=1 Tax=Herbaspirillum chlorophenolicum TaxID=211589 RepID=A0ABW8EY79_9BURK|nr:DUF6602 domain-containing protein [Herbaspirillum chlorophenolicum]